MMTPDEQMQAAFEADDYVRARQLTLRETLAIATWKALYTKHPSSASLRADVLAARAVHHADELAAMLERDPASVAELAAPKTTLGQDFTPPRPNLPDTPGIKPTRRGL